jgi:hypothetical protein
MESTTAGSDMGIGLTLVFSLLTVGGAVVMFGSGDQFTAALGFGLAIVAASLAVVASQALW